MSAAIEISPSATPEEILATWKEAQLKSGVDPNAAFVETFSKQPSATVSESSQQTAARTTTAEPAPQTFTRVVTIGGRDFEFNATSELELARLVNNAYAVAEGIRPEHIATTQQPDPAQTAITDFDLDRQFRAGTISAADYLQRSSALKTYFESQGVSLDDLRTATEQQKASAYEKSWAQATDDFLHSAEGADWPGGDQNREILGTKLIALGLEDASDKVAAIKQAYASLKQSNLVFRNDAAAGNTNQPARDTATGRFASGRQQSSGLFGASSGGSGEISSEPNPNAPVTIDPNATPEQILEAWKADQLKRGMDPNATFVETFSSKK